MHRAHAERLRQAILLKSLGKPYEQFLRDGEKAPFEVLTDGLPHKPAPKKKVSKKKKEEKEGPKEQLEEDPLPDYPMEPADD